MNNYSVRSFQWLRNILNSAGVKTEFREHHHQTVVVMRIQRPLWPPRIPEQSNFYEVNRSLESILSRCTNEHTLTDYRSTNSYAKLHNNSREVEKSRATYPSSSTQDRRREVPPDQTKYDSQRT